MSVMIDTLGAKKELTKAGVKAKEAEAIVKVLSSANEQVTTKADLEVLKHELVAIILKAQLGGVVALPAVSSVRSRTDSLPLKPTGSSSRSRLKPLPS